MRLQSPNHQVFEPSSLLKSVSYAAGVMQITVSDVSKKDAYTKHTTIEIRDEKI